MPKGNQMNFEFVRNPYKFKKKGTDRFKEKKHYNFKMIIAIGYRVRSNVGMHFRNWASHLLEKYSHKGFAMDDERLKNPKQFGENYFDELLERIHEIEASEKQFYQKICDIYKTSIDYFGNDNEAKLFFKTVQNKIHYGVHGHTMAEIIMQRADATKDNMGLTAFKGAKVRKKDVDIAKKYLNENEMQELNRVITMYLDFAEDQARRYIPMYMKDWENYLNNFLDMTRREVLSSLVIFPHKSFNDCTIAEIFYKFTRKMDLSSKSSRPLVCVPVIFKCGTVRHFTL